MIGYLKGTIIDNDLKSVVLLVSGIGYKIHTNTAILGSENSKKEAEFWTYLAVRENAMDLYGFQTKEELKFFELLLTVSGIGPKSAISILNIASIQNLRQAISSGDTTHLTKISGIGKKNADKIVVELKDKLDLDYVGEANTSLSGDIDALEALKSLGYGERESREALKKVGRDKETGEKIKEAMKLLS